MKKLYFSILFLFSMFLLSGCATIVHGTRQEISVNSEPSGAKVCITKVRKDFKGEVLANNNPIQPTSVLTIEGLMAQQVCAMTPVVFDVRKKDLKMVSWVQLEKEGYKPTAVALKGKVHLLFLAEAFFTPFIGVGLPGFIVDSVTGAGAKYYPCEINVVLEKW